AVMIVGMAKRNPKLGPPVTGYSWSERFASLPAAAPILFVVAIIMYCIYGGWGTPTEAGALGAFVVLCMALYRGMRWKDLSGALIESAKLTTMIFTMIWGVLIFVRYLGFADLPNTFAAFIAGLHQPAILTLLIILGVYVILGMFMDAIGMLILTLPVTYPAVIALNGGIDITREASSLGMSGEECGIWFGIIVVKMAELCLITPPIGLNCFVVAGVRPDISVQDVFRGASPFFVADVVTVGVLIAFPGIVLWLPNLL
ncbi:MAG: TRAP transporter large permease subunit, partial [Paracoccaceae bacterium]|nr:TRAP transporter large permease subunit [Paracoccaceae bacterium]